LFLSLRILDLFWVLLNVCGSLFLRGKGLVYTFTGLSPLWIVDWALGFFVSECYGVFGWRWVGSKLGCCGVNVWVMVSWFFCWFLIFGFLGCGCCGEVCCEGFAGWEGYDS